MTKNIKTFVLKIKIKNQIPKFDQIKPELKSILVFEDFKYLGGGVYD